MRKFFSDLTIGPHVGPFVAAITMALATAFAVIIVAPYHPMALGILDESRAIDAYYSLHYGSLWRPTGLPVVRMEVIQTWPRLHYTMDATPNDVDHFCGQNMCLTEFMYNQVKFGYADFIVKGRIYYDRSINMWGIMADGD